MRKAYLDFETFFSDDISVVKQGNANYTAASDAYIVGVAVEGGEVECGTLAETGPKIEQMAKDPTLEPWAANSGFDESWAEKYGWHFKNPWQCALDLSAFHQLPRNLAGFVKQVNGHEMDKSTRNNMRGVHYEELSPEEQLHMQEYCAEDVSWMATAIDEVAPMTSVERRIAEYTRRSNKRGILMDVDRVKKDRLAIEEAQHKAFKAVPWNQDAALGSPNALKDWCLANNIPAPTSRAKTNDYCNQLMREHPKLAEVMGQLRLHNKSNTMIKKIDALLDRVRPDNILPTDLMYCGAPHTRRWSSRGFNIQNLEKTPTDFGGRQVFPRNWIIPRPGKIFLILDYAQIEPRCLNWLADNFVMLDAMRSGFSYYEAYAVMARGWNGAQGTLKKELGGKGYTLLKNECLGCVSEGTLVLTQDGYIPIDKVSKGAKLWDGGQWVTHDGVIYKGAKPIISLGHEAYTLDHEIFFGAHQKEQAGAMDEGQQAAALAWRKPPGSAWEDVWQVARAVFNITAQEGLSACGLSLHWLRNRAASVFGQLADWGKHAMQCMWPEEHTTNQTTCGLGADSREVRPSAASSLVCD